MFDSTSCGPLAFICSPCCMEAMLEQTDCCVSLSWWALPQPTQPSPGSRRQEAHLSAQMYPNRSSPHFSLYTHTLQWGRSSICACLIIRIQQSGSHETQRTSESGQTGQPFMVHLQRSFWDCPNILLMGQNWQEWVASVPVRHKPVMDNFQTGTDPQPAEWKTPADIFSYV